MKEFRGEPPMDNQRTKGEKGACTSFKLLDNAEIEIRSFRCPADQIFLCAADHV